MTYPIDPPEPTEEEMLAYEQEQALKRTPTVRIEGLTAESVEILVREAVRSYYHLDQHAKNEVDRQIKKAVHAAIGERLLVIADEIVRPVIAEIVREGWSQTDTWGNPTGKTLSLKQRVTEYLFGKSDRYSSERPIESIFREELKKGLASEAGEALQKAIAELRKKVDEELSGRVIKAMRESLGLKP